MDTLYLVFKHQFQIVFGVCVQTIKLCLKQTETLTQEFCSVKRGLGFGKCYLYRTKRPPFSLHFQEKSGTFMCLLNSVISTFPVSGGMGIIDTKFSLSRAH